MLAVASVYETKPWTFLQQAGEEGMTYQAAMALLEESEAVMGDHRGFSLRRDVGGVGGEGAFTDRQRERTETNIERHPEA